jgi:hypothetical protein
MMLIGEVTSGAGLATQAHSDDLAAVAGGRRTCGGQLGGYSALPPFRLLARHQSAGLLTMKTSKRNEKSPVGGNLPSSFGQLSPTKSSF